jgi:lipoprotein-releasing system permease protein
LNFPIYIAKRYFNPKHQGIYYIILLGFIFLGLGFIGLGIVHYLFFRDFISNNLPNLSKFHATIPMLVEISFVFYIVFLFLKFYKSLILRIVFAIVGSLTGLGLPVILAIFLYKAALKKIPNIINLMSAISVMVVSFGTMALVIVLSVFNGFDDVIKSLFNSFDPDLKISLVEGKTFQIGHPTLKNLEAIKGIVAYSKVVEESVLLKYGEKQFPATMKGVDSNYIKTNGIDTMIVDGAFTLTDEKGQYAVIGQGIAYYLQVGLKFITPLNVYFPRKEANISMNIENAFNHKYIFPSGIFAIEQERDNKYMIVPIKFAFELLEDSLSISAIEIKVSKNAETDEVKASLRHLLGNRFKIQDRYDQQELFYRIMKYEKWAIFMILAFILVIASFNILGCLSMLIIEKKKDISTLNSIGAGKLLIRRIFLYEGMMISFFGAVIGLILGLIVCWLQIKFGFISLEGSGSFIIDKYPVSIRVTDIFFAFITVLGIGYLAARYPVKYIIRNYLPENNL